MGLPSGNRWAISNLDTTGPYYFQQSPFQYECSYFSWGNVTPHNPISATAFDYNFGGVNPSAPYYEGQPYGDTPGSLLTGNIPLTMDAARRMLGSPWRMPAPDDFNELYQNVKFIDSEGNEITTTDKRVVVNGILGIYMESKINGERLFLPCSGYGSDTSLQNGERYGYYWSNARASGRAGLISFIYTTVYAANSSDKYRGLPIRPIWNPRDLRE